MKRVDVILNKARSLNNATKFTKYKWYHHDGCSRQLQPNTSIILHTIYIRVEETKEGEREKDREIITSTNSSPR